MSALNKFLEYETKNYFILKLQKKISRKLKIYFIPTNYNKLPNNSYQAESDINYQNYLIEKFQKEKKINSFNTFPKIVNLLDEIPINREKNFNFLDFGGENIDFYLDLNKNFRNLNYFVINQNKINDNLIALKDKYNFKNMLVLRNFEEVKKNTYDFVNFGSTIQYIDNYYDILRMTIKLSKKFIFFSGTHFYSQNNGIKATIVLKQINLLPRKFYCYFFNYKEFLRIFEKNKYSLVFKRLNKSDTIKYGNLENIQNVEYSDLLLSK
tara:strand:+ start:11050 stop:11850 length:801 start_codon:yes stop_codon:yes gene_type:complete